MIGRRSSSASRFFQVGLLLLGPITFALARETKTPDSPYWPFDSSPRACPQRTASFPRTRARCSASAFSAEPRSARRTAWSIFVVGPPVALVVTGPLLARWVSPQCPVALGGLGAQRHFRAQRAARAPSFGSISIFTMLLPVLLMLVATVAERSLPSAAEKQHKTRGDSIEQQQTGAAGSHGQTAPRRRAAGRGE